jgi:hypothetical protein
VFDTLQEAFDWAKKQYGDKCSFSVRAQKDGPTIVSIKGKGGVLRQVVYVKKGNADAGKTV